MSLASELSAALKKVEHERRKSEAFIKLREFYELMLKEGVALKKGYDLPPLDTIGRSAHKTSQE